MKVLYVYNQQRGRGGSNQSTRTTIELMRRHGLAVEVFTRDSNEIANNLMGHIQVGCGAFYPRKALRCFSDFLSSSKPDVVHVYELFPLISPWILPVCLRRRIPVVMSCDDYHATCPVRTHLSHGEICTRCCGGHEYWAALRNCRGNLSESTAMALYSATTRRLGLFHRNVSRYIAPSEFTRNWLAKYLQIEPAAFATVPPAVPIPATGIDPAAGEYAAFAGRFAPEKGIETLLEAERISGIPVRLSRSQDSVSTIGMSGNNQVVITSSPAGLDAFYRGARMLVSPSVWLETFGLAAAEAMAYGLPVVVSRIGALSELVEDGVDGLLFDPGNASDLAEKMKRLWNDPSLCSRLGAAARQKASTCWSEKRHFEKLMAIYECVVAHSRVADP